MLNSWILFSELNFVIKRVGCILILGSFTEFSLLKLECPTFMQLAALCNLVIYGGEWIGSLVHYFCLTKYKVNSSSAVRIKPLTSSLTLILSDKSRGQRQQISSVLMDFYLLKLQTSVWRKACRDPWKTLLLKWSHHTTKSQNYEIM